MASSLPILSNTVPSLTIRTLPSLTSKIEKNDSVLAELAVLAELNRIFFVRVGVRTSLSAPGADALNEPAALSNSVVSVVLVAILSKILKPTLYDGFVEYFSRTMD